MVSITERPSDATPYGRKETSIWDVYNHTADLRDNELIKDWNNNLHFLLIFTAIFASILTGFLIESIKLLQLNPQDTTNAILICISQRLKYPCDYPIHTTSFPFEPAPLVKTTNALLFTSLCLSLVAALAAVAALQWVNGYDAGLSTFDARRRALVRHARFTGTERVVMGGIISALPLLLYAYVFLSFAGMTTLLWIGQTDTTLFAIGLGTTTVVLILYLFSLVFAADYTNTPPRRRGFRALRLLALSPAIVITFSVSYLYGRLIGLPGLMQTLTEPVWRLVGGASSEQATAKDLELESLLIEWTASNVNITRLLHIINQATPSLLANTTLSGPWDQIGDRTAKLLICPATFMDLCDGDLNAICIMVNFWTVVRSRYSEYWSWKAASEDNWTDWKPALKLIGSLDVQGIMAERELATVAMLIEIRILGEGERSSQTLNEVTATLLNCANPPPPHIFRYAISSLSTYLWTHTRTTFYDRIVDLLISLLALPAGRFHSSPLSPIERSLVLSALYSVTFGPSDGPRRYWSLRHPFLDLIQPRDNLKTVQSLHLAITNHYAAASIQMTSAYHTRKYLRYFTCLLAYTPANQVGGDHLIQRAKRILAQGDPGIPTEDRITPAALSSLIWMSNMESITSIHEYLGVLLSCRNRFPSLKPVWRDWLTSAELENYTDIGIDDRAWLAVLQNDRRLTELMSAFDQLVFNGCHVKRHLVMVQIIIDDLSEDTGSDYDRYYTEQRIQQLKNLRDPALRLLGARAANIPYTGKVPPKGDFLWRAAPWLEAMSFWCRTYQDCDIMVDSCLLHGAIIEGNTKLFSEVRETSSTNSSLGERLYHILQASWNSNYDAEEVLLLHASTLGSPLLTKYLSTSNSVARLLDIIPPPGAADIRVLPLLSSFVISIDNFRHFQAISATISAALVNSDKHPCQPDIDRICTPFETILRAEPGWLVAAITADGDRWMRISEHINKIVSFFRAPENKCRELIRWKAHTRSPRVKSEVGMETYRHDATANGPVQKEQLSSIGTLEPVIRGKVTPGRQFGTATSADHAHFYDTFEVKDYTDSERTALEDRLYSCSACWDI